MDPIEHIELTKKLVIYYTNEIFTMNDLYRRSEEFDCLSKYYSCFLFLLQEDISDTFLSDFINIMFEVVKHHPVIFKKILLLTKRTLKLSEEYELYEISQKIYRFLTIIKQIKIITHDF